MSNILLKVDHNSTYVEGGYMPSSLYQGLKAALGFTPEGVEWMVRKNSTKGTRQQWQKDWDGVISNVCRNRRWCKCFIKKDGIHFSSGLLNLAIQYLDDNNASYEIIDIRDKGGDPIDLSMSDEFQRRDYQTDVIDKAEKAQRGVIKAATGSGKTGIASAIIAEVGMAPTIFYVTSRDLLRQAKTELERFLLQNGSSMTVGAVGDSKKDIRDITVMTVQTAVRALGAKYKKFDEEDIEKDDTDIDDMKENIKELIKDARCMIADECQHWQAETCQIIADASEKCTYRFAFSATPWRDTGDDILIDACFGKCIADISASFLIQQGYLVKPEIFFVPVNNIKSVSKCTYAEVYKKAIVENSLRNKYISDMANTMRDDGRVVLILCRQIVHGNMLSELIPGSMFMHGKHTSKKRKERLDIMRDREPSVTLATSIFDEGIDCEPLDTLILAGSGKSQTRALQRVGRVLRKYKGKKGALVVDFEDNCKYMLAHSKKRKAIYQTEPEFDVKYLEVD